MTVEKEIVKIDIHRQSVAKSSQKETQAETNFGATPSSKPTMLVGMKSDALIPSPKSNMDKISENTISEAAFVPTKEDEESEPPNFLAPAEGRLLRKSTIIRPRYQMVEERRRSPTSELKQTQEHE